MEARQTRTASVKSGKFTIIDRMSNVTVYHSMVLSLQIERERLPRATSQKDDSRMIQPKIEHPL